MLDNWMILLSQTVESTGPSAILFGLVLLLAGPFFMQQLFIANMVVQLEQLHDDARVDVSRKIINQWIRMREHQAFAKWKSHWYEKDQHVKKVYKSRIVLHEDAMVKTLLRWRNFELMQAWNSWYGLVQLRQETERRQAAITGQSELPREHQVKEVVQRRRRIQRELTTKEILQQALVSLANSQGLEKYVAAVVVISIVLMGLQGSCDSTMGRIAGCSSGDRTKFVIFVTVVEALLLATTCLFALEALLKLVALGPKYLENVGNLFDFTIAIVALTELVTVGKQLSCQIHAIENKLTSDTSLCASQSSGAQALRAFRLVRLARLLRRYPTIRHIGILFSYVLSKAWGECSLTRAM